MNKRNNKAYFQNLGMIITNKCNLDCRHCLRGCKNNKDMSKEVINKVLSECAIIGNLAICGGEPTMALPTLEYIINYVIDNHVFLEELTLTINGTIYSEELLRLLDEVDSYIHSYIDSDESRASYTISYDMYHTEELKRLNIYKEYLENVYRYSKSPHFYAIQELKRNKKLFREGNAKYLDKKITIDLKPITPIITYVSNSKRFDRENGLCNIGPIITVNTDGIITECNASIENQSTIYNYGNVLEESIEDTVLRMGKVLKPKKWYRTCNKEINRYRNYNK